MSDPMKLLDKVNFLGTGKTMQQWLTDNARERWARAWTFQSIEVRRPRLDYIKHLVKMQEAHILLHTSFGVADYDMAIEAIIDGDVEKLQMATALATSGGGEPRLAAEGEVTFAAFVRLCGEIAIIMSNEKNLIKQLENGGTS